MKIVRLQAENVKKLKAVEITPEGNVVKITGKNAQGKTSVLDAIWWALGGTKGIQEQPIRKGETRANVTLDLGDITVTRTFTESGSYLKVENKDGASFKSPQAVLDKLIGQLSFDPLAFARADKKKQVETLLSVVNLKVDAKALETIAGTSFQWADDPLTTLNNAYRAVYDSRTLVNRQLDQAKKMLQSLPEVEETQPVSIVDLVAEKERLERANRERDKKFAEASAIEAHIHNLEHDIAAIQDEIRKLEVSLQAKIKAREQANADYVRAHEEAVKLPCYELTEINSRIASADETNRKAQAWQERQKAVANMEQLQSEANDHSRRLEAIKEFKNKLIADANFPIKGLDFGGGGVLYNGVPFEQASSAEKLQVSLAIAMALNPKLRIIRIDDASLLDNEHLSIIESMAKENDFQVWMEVVDESGKVGVYIEDGEVKTKEKAS